MSDQTPSLSSLGSVDGKNLINVPGGGGGGVTSINGDATAAQTLVSGGGITIVDSGGGVHTFSVPSPLPVPPFAPGQAGIVTDPGAAPAASYLRADNTFATLPAALASINGDPTAAQTLVGSGCSIIDTGGGGHTISIDFPDFVLGVGVNLDLQAAATYNLFNVSGGFSGAVVTRVLMVLVSGNPSITADGNFVLNSVATAGINDFWNDPAGTSNFDPTVFKQAVSLTYGTPVASPGPGPLYPAGDSFQLVSAGGTDPAVFMVFVFGFLVS
jgi:hypothetical protein